jgi:hypothetical protein
MTEKLTDAQIVANYLAACRPPLHATTAEISEVLAAWNRMVTPKPSESHTP